MENSSVDRVEAAFALLSVDYWKMLKAFDRAAAWLPEDRRQRAESQARFARDRLAGAMQRCDMMLGLYEGRAVDGTLPIIVVNADEHDSSAELIVIETIEPAVLAGSRVLQSAKVIAGEA